MISTSLESSLQVNLPLLPVTKTRDSSRSRRHMPRACPECQQFLKVLTKQQISIFLPVISQALKNLKKSSSSCYPKTEEALRSPKVRSIDQYLCCTFLLRSWRDLSIVYPLLLLQEQELAFDEEDQL